MLWGSRIENDTRVDDVSVRMMAYKQRCRRNGLRHDLVIAFVGQNQENFDLRSSCHPYILQPLRSSADQTRMRPIQNEEEKKARLRTERYETAVSKQ